MTTEEKQAITAVLLDEIAAQQQQNPTLLIDALLSGQGYQLVHLVLQRNLAIATGRTQALTQLLRALNGGNGHAPAPRPAEEE